MLAVRILLESRSAKRANRAASLNEIWRDLAAGILPRQKLPEPWCAISTAAGLKKSWERLPLAVRSRPGDFIYRSQKKK